MDKYVGFYSETADRNFVKSYIEERKKPGDTMLPMQREEQEMKTAWINDWKANQKPLPVQASVTFGIQGYKCRVCKEYNVKMMTVQTRSLDERSCNIFQCLNSKCNAVWKQ